MINVAKQAQPWALQLPFETAAFLRSDFLHEVLHNRWATSQCMLPHAIQPSDPSTGCILDHACENRLKALQVAVGRWLADKLCMCSLSRLPAQRCMQPTSDIQVTIGNASAWNFVDIMGTALLCILRMPVSYLYDNWKAWVQHNAWEDVLDYPCGTTLQWTSEVFDHWLAVWSHGWSKDKDVHEWTNLCAFSTSHKLAMMDLAERESLWLCCC